MTLNRIGPFTFVRLSQPPQFAQQQLAIRSRPGVDGVMLQRLGTRADPFQCESFVDAPTLLDAYELYRQYTTIVGIGAVPVIWGGIPMLANYHVYHVTHVEPVEIRAIVQGHGGLNGISYAFTRCLWTLQPVITT